MCPYQILCDFLVALEREESKLFWGRRDFLWTSTWPLWEACLCMNSLLCFVILQRLTVAVCQCCLNRYFEHSFLCFRMDFRCREFIQLCNLFAYLNSVARITEFAVNAFSEGTEWVGDIRDHSRTRYFDLGRSVPVASIDSAAWGFQSKILWTDYWCVSISFILSDIWCIIYLLCRFCGSNGGSSY